MSNKRSLNFSEKEVELLISLVKKHKECVESKKSDAVTWKEKERGWDELTQEFNKENKKSGNDFDTASTNLKNKWDNLKKNSRKKFALEKQNIYKTGGGPAYPSFITEQDEEIKEVIGVSCTGLDSCFDSDRFEVINTDENGDVVLGDKSWTSWNPSCLKQPISKQLIDKQPQQPKTNMVDADIIIESPQAQPDSLDTPRKEKDNIPPHKVGIRARNTRKRKCEITQDARANISALSKVRIDLATIQAEYYKQEIEHKQEEHDLKLKQMEEAHALEMEKKRAEFEILKKNI